MCFDVITFLKKDIIKTCRKTRSVLVRISPDTIEIMETVTQTWLLM